MPSSVTPAQIASLPSVLLHDHLDGGLRPETMVELADATGYRGLPSDDPSALSEWMRRGAGRGDLVLYLETFVHTVGVMQTADALARVARECAEDLATDGVVHAEVRFAPELHTEGGLSLDGVVEAVLDGFRAGAEGSSIGMGPIVTAMRTSDRSLETFVHTVGVMQTADALTRVARECAEDLAADGVVHAEVRFAPELHTQGGLPLDAVVEAVLDGFKAGAEGSSIGMGPIVTAMRTSDRSLEIAELAVRWADRGVVGFDLAGAEAGFPATAHRAAFERVLADGRLGTTIHAGEGDGLDSIRDALACGGQRIGHGVRLADDLADDGERPSLGPLAREIRDRGVPLEMCPTSNVHSGAVASIEEHPVGVFADLGFRVTINTDNRLMSATTLSQELARVARANGWELDRIEQAAITAAESAFLPPQERRRLVEQVIRPAFRRFAGPAAEG